MTARRYWRLKFDSTQRGYCSCATLQLREVLNGSDLTTNVVAQAIGGSAYNGSPGTYGFEKAFDRDVSTAYSSNGYADWVGFDFGTGNEKTIIEFVYTGRQGDPNASPVTGGLEWSDDATSWIRSIDIGTQTGWTDGETRTFDAPSSLPPQSVSKAGQYVIEGPPSIPQSISKLAAYVVEGSDQKLFVSKLAAYVVIGPPPSARRRSGTLIA